MPPKAQHAKSSPKPGGVAVAFNAWEPRRRDRDHEGGHPPHIPALGGHPVPGQRLDPNELREAFRLAEHHRWYNEWVGLICGLRQDFGAYRWRVVPAASADGRNKRKAFDAWKERVADTLETLHGQVWYDWVTFQNVIVGQLPKADGFDNSPMVLAPKDCLYTDRLGSRKLEYAHSLTADEVSKLPQSWRKAFEGGRLKFHEIPGARFDVLKEARLGDGLGPPAMWQVFHACLTASALAAADGSLAEAARRVIRQHKLGYEIRNGPMQGSPARHASPARIKAVRSDSEGRVGYREFADNFDHEIILHSVDPKFFDAKRLATVEHRFLIWGAPLGHMLFTRGGVAPFLMKLLRIRTIAMRERVGRFLSRICRQFLGAPVDVEFRYDSRILNDDRLAADMLKWSLTSGLASQRTSRTEVDLDDEEERRIKEEESRQPLSVKVPVYDPNHGPVAFGKAPATKGGRPRSDGSPAE